MTSSIKHKLPGVVVSFPDAYLASVFNKTTIGDVEDMRLTPDVAGPALIAAAKLVYDLRNAFPEHILVQNSGLDKLWKLTARYVDAFYWKSFYMELEDNRNRAIDTAYRLLQAKVSYGPHTLLLSEVKGVSGGDNNRLKHKNYLEFAKKMGFPIYLAEPGYTKNITVWLANPGCC